MKLNFPLLQLLAAGFLTAGCDRPVSTSQQIDNTQAKTTAAARDLRDYTFAQKAEFTKRVQSDVAEINRDLELLAARVEKSSDAVKAEAKPKLDSLREQATKLNMQLEQAGNATESTWESIKAGTRTGYEALKEGFQESRRWMSDKIAP